MATVSIVTAVWSGFTGAPGYSKFSFFELADVAQCNAAGAAVRTFFFSQRAFLNTDMTINVQSVVQHKDLATGDLTGETAMSSPPAVVNGLTANTTAYSGGSGFVCDWITGQIWNGRKVRGRTFFVPAIGVYSPDGTISSATQNTAQNAANALIADPTTTLGVWAKKFDGADPPQQVAGALFAVTGSLVPDRAAQLRTRRS